MLHDPLYHVTIHEIHSEQTVFRGVVSGKLAPFIADGGCIRDAVETTDAGRLLTPAQKKKAFHNGRR